MNRLLAMVLGILPCVASADAPYVEEIMTLQQARDLIEGCERYATAQDLPALSMAIYDAAGNLKLFVRQDGTTVATADFAHSKGRTAAITALTTSELAEIEYADSTQPLGMPHLGALTIVQGGVPVRSVSGQHLGGFGVSGAPAADDEACGRAGIEHMQGAKRE